MKTEKKKSIIIQGETYWRFQYVDPIDNIDVVKTLPWDYAKKDFLEDVIVFLKEKRRKTSEYNKKINL